MGEIFVEGLGTVELEGDTPNDVEQNAILGAIGTGEGDPSITALPPEQSDTQPEPERPEGLKEQVRQSIEDAPGLVQLVAEMTPAVGGAVAGATIGSIGGPIGTVVGGVIGGLGGEFLAQKTGVAPESDLNLALSAAGPVAGEAFGVSLRGVRFLLGGAVSKAPFTRVARARNAMGGAGEEFESLGEKILSKPKGVVKKEGGEFVPTPAKELYAQARAGGVIVPVDDLSRTTTAIAGLLEEMEPLKAFPEVKQAGKLLKNIQATIEGGEIGISIDTLVETRKLVGLAVKRAESAGGLKLGKSKSVFSAIADDMDAIAQSPALKGRKSRLALAATKRAKLGFAVKDLERGVAQFTKDMADGGAEINLVGFQKWFRNITNPKSKQFKKNFVDALEDELPEIKARLATLVKMGAPGSSPGGPGSLVLRNRFAVIGGGIGAFVSGVPGAAVGAVAGASAPEMIVGALVTKRGGKWLERAARLGDGKVSHRAWMALGTILARSAGDQEAQAAEVGPTDSDLLVPGA